jgi:hypothetical protein
MARGKDPGPRRRFMRRLAPTAVMALLLVVALPTVSGASSSRSGTTTDQPVTVNVAASEPGAAVDEDLTGINHVVAGSGPALQSAGIRWARTDVSFEITTGSGPAYNCATGAWNPSYLDSQVALDQAAGATPELIVDYTPPCLATDPPNGVNPNYTPPDIGADQAAWQALVYQMALHEITAEGVRVFEVWNEPNLGQFWTGGLSGYLTLYRDTAQALEEAATQAGVAIEVGGPALGEFNGLDTSWITALASYVETNHLPLDFVSWHLYANNPDLGPSDSFANGLCVTGTPPAGLPCYNPDLSADLYAQQTQAVRTALAPYTGVDPLLWIDEWNINAGEDARTDGPYGAAFVAAVLDQAEGAGLDRMSFFDTADNGSDPTQNWGLLQADLTPKPAYFAMQMWHQLTGSLLPVTVHSKGSGTTGVGAVASSGPDGTLHVMVYNFTPYDPTGVYGTSDPTPSDHPVTIKIGGLPRGTYDINRTLIDANHDGSSVGTSTVSASSIKLSFTLSGEGVTLLTAAHETPSVTKLSRTSGPGAGGNTVTITGTSLGQASTVLFGGVPATSVSVNGPGTLVKAGAPPHAAGTVDVEVTTPWGTSGPDVADEYTFEGPTVTRVAPKTGPGGTKVSVTGTGLQGATAVVFGAVPAATFSGNTAGTKITAYAPDESAGPVDIEVTTPGGTSPTTTADQFTYP